MSTPRLQESRIGAWTTEREHERAGGSRARRRRPMARRPGAVAGRPALRPRAARARRRTQRRRPLPLLDDGGDRRRPRPAPASVPRRHRELAARPQHRLDRAHRERLPRRDGAHRRPQALEQARRDGDRPLPARAAPRDGRRPRRVGRAATSCRSSPSTTSATRSTSRATALPERCILLFGQEGPGLTDEALAAAQATVHIRQYGSTRSINAAAAAAHRDARMDAAARRSIGWGVIPSDLRGRCRMPGNRHRSAPSGATKARARRPTCSAAASTTSSSSTAATTPATPSSSATRSTRCTCCRPAS